MITNDVAGKMNKRFLRDLVAGAVGLFAAIVLVLITLRFQDYMTTNFLLFALFIFPVPVGCGLAVGLISPKRAIVWAPLWAAISTALLFAILSGGIHNASISISPLRLIFMLIGVLLAGLAGYSGQFARQMSYVAKSVLTFLLLCFFMGFGQHIYVSHRTRAFERAHVDQINYQVDRDYIALPIGVNWECRRRPDQECYEFHTTRNHRRLSVLVAPTDSDILGVSYTCKGGRSKNSNTNSARRYLLDLGFRHPMLGGLVENRGRDKSWMSGFNGTSLHLSASGVVTLRILPVTDKSIRGIRLLDHE